MRSGREHPRLRLVEYDSFRHRLWVLGQRCHHGATGALVASLACIGLITDREDRRPLATLGVAAGSVLMLHDWKDHSIWFERGHGTQP